MEAHECALTGETMNFIPLVMEDTGEPYTIYGKQLEQGEDGKTYRLDGYVYTIDPLVFDGTKWTSGTLKGNILLGVYARAKNLPPTSPEIQARYRLLAPGKIKIGRWWTAISDANKAGAVSEPDRTNVINASIERTAAEEHARTVKAKKIVGIVIGVVAAVTAVAAIKHAVTTAAAKVAPTPEAPVTAEMAEKAVSTSKATSVVSSLMAKGKDIAAKEVTKAITKMQEQRTPEERVIMTEQPGPTVAPSNTPLLVGGSVVGLMLLKALMAA